jgi:cobalt-zinc-cadmium efflux system outer membrane protein
LPIDRRFPVHLRIRVFLALAGMCGATQWSAAADELRLDQAVARSLRESPLLKARAAELDAVRMRAERESLPAPWYVAADLENVAGSGALGGADAAELTFRVGRDLELGGKRAARRALGDAQISSKELDAALIENDLHATTTIRFVEVLADQSRLMLAHEVVALAERTRDEVARFVDAARNPESDLRLAEVAWADAQLLREHAEHELASARVTLAATWGAWQPDFDSVIGELAPLPPAGTLEVFMSRLTTGSAQRRRELELGIASARRTLTRANATPDLTLSVGVRRFESFDDHGLVFGASMPVGKLPRARLALAEGEAEMVARREQGLHDLAELNQQLFEMYQELIHARTEHETLSTAMVPKAEQASRLSRLGFERGRLPLTALLQAQQLLFDLRRRQIDAAVRYHHFLAELHRLTGTPQDPTP